MQRRLTLAPLLIALVALIVVLALGAAAMAQEAPLHFSLDPAATRPGGIVTARLFSEDAGFFQSVTLSLAPLGLPDVPMTAHLSTFSATFTVPHTTPPGDYNLRAAVQERYSQRTAFARLRVTRGILVESATFQPDRIMAGQATTLTAVVTSLEGSVTSVTADLSAFGLSSAAPLAPTQGSAYALSFTAPTSAGEGYYPIAVKATDSAGGTFTRTARLEVYVLRHPILLRAVVVPEFARPGQTVTLNVSMDLVNCLPLAVTADLTSVHLSPETPLTGLFGRFSSLYSVSFPVPDREGWRRIPVRITDDCGGEIRGQAAFTVTRGTIITSVEFEVPTVRPGETTTIAATVEPGTKPTTAVTADLSAFGLSKTEPLTDLGSPGRYYRTFTAPAATAPGKYSVTVTATDAVGRASNATGSLEVAMDFYPISPLEVEYKSVPTQARPGESVTFTFSMVNNPCGLSDVTADLSALGLSDATPYEHVAAQYKYLSFTIPASAEPGIYRILTTVVDTCRRTFRYGLILTVTRAPGPPILYVRQSATGPADGASWATAFPTVQRALDAALPGDSIRVAAGTYVENLVFPTERVTLLGGFKGVGAYPSQRDVKANVTILDGNAAGSVLLIPSGSAGVTVDGFTIRNGKAEWGGGLHIAADGVRVTRNVITQNTASGIYGYGGGLYGTGRSLVVSGNIFRNNTADGAAYGQGGGIHLYNGSGRISNNLFAGCVATGGDAAEGGAIRCLDANAEVIGNTITQCGGFVSRPTTFCFGFAIAARGGFVTFVNNIVAFNTNGVTLANGQVDYNLGYENGRCGDRFPGVFNRYADPLFVDAENDDYRLRPDSPAINAGNDALTLPGETDLAGGPRIQGRRVDMGAYEAPAAYTLADVAEALRLAGGLSEADDSTRWADIAGDGAGVGEPDGQITLLDAIAIVRLLTASAP